MNTNTRILPPDALWQTLCERAQQALASGALQPTAIRTEIVEDQGVRFRIGVATALVRKDAAEQPGGGNPANPFLPPEPALVVGALSPTHLAVLNKFNIVEHHLLLVTMQFESQESLLTRADVEALQICLAQYDALAFHNAGRVAGASQPHKHLQVMPLPLADDAALPMEPIFAGAPAGAVRVPRLAFAHAFTHLPPRVSGAELFAHYRRLLADVGISEVTIHGERRQSMPYNLLLTRRWMLLVPRTRECFDAISLNAVAFAGSLFVRSAGQLQALKAVGPFAALRAVASP
jgi:ATP adenylyltransferase